MGKLIDGKWNNQWYDTTKTKGKFIREAVSFRHTIANIPLPQVTPIQKFPAEKNRYHLYISLACPWAHRTLIFRHLKSLEEIISISIVSTDMLENGWTFDKTTGSTGDGLYQYDYLHQLYTLAQHNYTGRVTVPVLWDKKEKTIVNNESADIIRIFNSAFNTLTGNTVDFYPQPLQSEIDKINNFIYEHINNGVYKAGFATTQAAYQEACTNLFNALDNLEHRLSQKRYLVGSQLTEADIRLFTTLVRFDAVYVGHFKCNQRTLESYTNLSNYVRDIYQTKNIANTVDIEQIKRHYYFSHKNINPTQIVPLGPILNFEQLHDRERYNNC